MSTGKPHHFGHLLQVSKKFLQPLTSYTSFHDLINVYSNRLGQTIPRGQNFDSNRNLLSLRSFATNLKKISLKFDLLRFFHDSIQPLGNEILMTTGTSCHFGHLLQV